MRDDEEYRDHPVRSYVLTSGRAHPTRNTLRPETLLVAVDGRPAPATASGQQRELLRLCRGTLALAEVAAYLGLPVSLVAVLVSDLVDTGHLTIRSNHQAHALPSRDVLEKVLDGLRNL
ncbi:DUF742 domain-containing protein [Antribacter gilvus]|uniref:DUF742 domain-containing protein n=1 Tax=Antribacter gilvus TaxID=2304675 RepID=UPI000F7B004B|nr:DUF742 domain-containing protein [Antribacter gilvus]